MRSPSRRHRKSFASSSAAGNTVSRCEMSATERGPLPRRVSTRWSPKRGFTEGTHSAVKPSGANVSAVSRPSSSTPARFSVKLLIPTIRSSVSSAAGSSPSKKCVRFPTMSATLFHAPRLRNTHVQTPRARTAVLRPMAGPWPNGLYIKMSSRVCRHRTAAMHSSKKPMSRLPT